MDFRGVEQTGCFRPFWDGDCRACYGLFLFLSYQPYKVKEIKRTMPSAADENVPATSCNTSPSEDLGYLCWTLLQNLGNELSCISNGIFVSMNCWCSYTISRIALGEPVNMLLFPHALHRCSSILQSRHYLPMLRGHCWSQLQKDNWIVSCMWSHHPFLLGLDLSSVLLSRH